jgi:hypothetical protein
VAGVLWRQAHLGSPVRSQEPHLVTCGTKPVHDCDGWRSKGPEGALCPSTFAQPREALMNDSYSTMAQAGLVPLAQSDPKIQTLIFEWRETYAPYKCCIELLQHLYLQSRKGGKLAHNCLENSTHIERPPLTEVNHGRCLAVRLLVHNNVDPPLTGQSHARCIISNIKAHN